MSSPGATLTESRKRLVARNANWNSWLSTISPATKALGLPPCPPGRWVPRASFKHHFSSFVRVETSKIRRKLRNLLRPWGPCPYHLHPRNQSPWTPPPEPLYPPSPRRDHFLVFVRGNVKNTRNLLRPWGPCPYHLPARHRSPWTPPEPQPRA